MHNVAPLMLRRGRRLPRVQCLAHGNLSKHERTPTIYGRHQHFSCDLPLCHFVFPLRQSLDVFASISQGSKYAAIRQHDRIVELARPAQCRRPLLPVSTLNPRGSCGGSVVLQTGQGAPGAPQPHAIGPSHGRSGWASQTQRQPSHRARNLSILHQLILLGSFCDGNLT